MPEEGRQAASSHNEMDGYADENVIKGDEIYSVPIRKDGEAFVKVEKK